MGQGRNFVALKTEGCTNQAKRGGVCKRHGAYRNAHNESTAFGSELEKNTVTQTAVTQILPNQCA
eukprot:scaffold45473_cov175-Skeletonema_marinoi.AAC.1